MDFVGFFFPHLQEVTHGLCVPVVGLSLPLHYHYLPWQVPGNTYYWQVFYLVFIASFEGGKESPDNTALWQGRVFDCGKVLDSEAESSFAPSLIIIISSCKTDKWEFSKSGASTFFTSFNLSLFWGLLWLLLHLWPTRHSDMINHTPPAEEWTAHLLITPHHLLFLSTTSGIWCLHLHSE